MTRAAKQYRHNGPTSDDPEALLIERGAQMLKIARDFEMLQAAGSPTALAIDTLRGRTDHYDPEILEAFAAIRSSQGQMEEVRELPISAVREGMILAEDLKMVNGTLLAARGYEVTTSFVERARHFRPGFVKGHVRVILRN